MKRHPLLCMCIRKNQSRDNCFQRMENACVNLCQLDTKDWKSVMEESLLKKFGTEKGPLLMRAVGMSLQGNCFTRKYGVEIQRNPQIQLRTKIIPVEFTKGETGRLLKKCKEFQTTVQGAVWIAAGVAMVIMMEEQEYEVECGLSVNSRPFFKSTVPNEYAGSVASLTKT